MRTNTLIFLAAMLLSCGGGGSSSNSSTTVNSCPDGSTQVSFADLPKVIEAAQDSNVTVEDHTSDSVDSVSVEEPALNQDQALRTGGVIIASCGGTVIANDSEDNDIVNGAQRLIAEIQLGRISKIEIYKGE